MKTAVAHTFVVRTLANDVRSADSNAVTLPAAAPKASPAMPSPEPVARESIHDSPPAGSSAPPGPALGSAAVVSAAAVAALAALGVAALVARARRRG